MFAKRRTTAALLIVGFLVASLGMFTPSTEAHHTCSYWASKCCSAICDASDECNDHGSGSSECISAQSYAGYVCATASEKCGFAVYCPSCIGDN